MQFNPQIDKYLMQGCMRCKFGGTPQCKVHKWTMELETLRQIALECGLTEELKWGGPCYTLEGKNVFMLGALKEACVIGFFKGALLKDKNNLLERPGASSQSTRTIKFTSIQQIEAAESAIRDLIEQAKQNELEGKKVIKKSNPEPMPEELLMKLEEDNILKEAFYKLTPGRQRSYIITISQAKQSATRFSRIEKYRDNILRGVDVMGR